MIRFFAVFSFFFLVSAASGQPADQNPGEYVSFFGHHYLTPTSTHPCASSSFNDHGQSVSLCIDSLGRPIEVDPNLVPPPPEDQSSG